MRKVKNPVRRQFEDWVRNVNRKGRPSWSITTALEKNRKGAYMVIWTKDHYEAFRAGRDTAIIANEVAK